MGPYNQSSDTFLSRIKLSIHWSCFILLWVHVTKYLVCNWHSNGPMKNENKRTFSWNFLAKHKELMQLRWKSTCPMWHSSFEKCQKQSAHLSANRLTWLENQLPLTLDISVCFCQKDELQNDWFRVGPRLSRAKYTIYKKYHENDKIRILECKELQPTLKVKLIG